MSTLRRGGNRTASNLWDSGAAAALEAAEREHALEAARDFERGFNKGFREDKNRVKITEDAVVRLHSAHVAAEKAREYGDITKDGGKKDKGFRSINLSDLKAQAVSGRSKHVPHALLVMMRLKDMDSLLLSAITYYRMHIKEDKYKKECEKGSQRPSGSMTGTTYSAAEYCIAGIREKKTRALVDIAQVYAFFLTSRKLKAMGPRYDHQVQEKKFFEALYDLVLSVVKMVFPAPSHAQLLDREHGRIFRSGYFNSLLRNDFNRTMFVDKMGQELPTFDLKTLMPPSVIVGRKDHFYGKDAMMESSYGAKENVTNASGMENRDRDADELALRMAIAASKPPRPDDSDPTMTARVVFGEETRKNERPLTDKTVTALQNGARLSPTKIKRPMSAPASTTAVKDGPSRAHRRAERIKELAKPKYECVDVRLKKRPCTAQSAFTSRSPLINSILPDAQEAIEQFWKSGWKLDSSGPTFKSRLRNFARLVQLEETTLIQRKGVCDDLASSQAAEGNDPNFTNARKDSAELSEPALSIEEIDRVQVTDDNSNFELSLALQGYSTQSRARLRPATPVVELKKRPRPPKQVWR